METGEKDILAVENERVEKQLSVNLLTPENAEFYETPGGFAALKHSDKDYGHINIICTFPFTAPEEYLSVRELEGKQEEIGIIKSLSEFDPATRSLLKKQLELRYFMPKILRLYSIKEEYGYTYWSVLTDKGKVKFTSASGSAGAVIQDGNRVIIKDSDENRFEIEDITALSSKEMKKLDLYL